MSGKLNFLADDTRDLDVTKKVWTNLMWVTAFEHAHELYASGLKSKWPWISC